MTVKELKDKLRGYGNDWELFVVTDYSDSNWDDEAYRWREVEPVESVYREINEAETGFGFEKEKCVIIELTQK